MQLIAFYLPQFHPIPENDQWWGEGFTDWTNAAKARPLFPGHYQPHVPADLGYYDLRQPEARQAQADLAREYGISGFCYYHYWFRGKRLLNLPFDEALASRQPDFPFCLCWANENWTRAWDGKDRDLLMKQEYSPEDDREHIRWLARAFDDKRYIRIDGKPLFLVYRASRLPNPSQTASLWRKEARRLGVGEIFLAKVESLPGEHGDPARIGFDAAIEFQPDWRTLGHRFQLWAGQAVRYRLYDYASVVQKMLRKTIPPYRYFRCVTPSWDNTSRRKNGAVIWDGGAPELYQEWLGGIIQQAAASGGNEPAVFINAWNEWGEGSHLEPCRKWGRRYLEATREAVRGHPAEIKI